MPPTRLFKATVLVLLAVMTTIATVGHVFHDAACSDGCELAAADRAPNQVDSDSHSACSHGHSHTTADPGEQNSPDKTPSHNGDECGVCIFLSLSSPTAVLTEAPRTQESMESNSVLSDSLVAAAPRRTKTARGPPSRFA